MYQNWKAIPKLALLIVALAAQAAPGARAADAAPPLKVLVACKNSSGLKKITTLDSVSAELEREANKFLTDSGKDFSQGVCQKVDSSKLGAALRGRQKLSDALTKTANVMLQLKDKDCANNLMQENEKISDLLGKVDSTLHSKCTI